MERRDRRRAMTSSCTAASLLPVLLPFADPLFQATTASFLRLAAAARRSPPRHPHVDEEVVGVKIRISSATMDGAKEPGCPTCTSETRHQIADGRSSVSARGAPPQAHHHIIFSISDYGVHLLPDGGGENLVTGGWMPAQGMSPAEAHGTISGSITAHAADTVDFAVETLKEREHTQRRPVVVEATATQVCPVLGGPSV